MTYADSAARQRVVFDVLNQPGERPCLTAADVTHRSGEDPTDLASRRRVSRALSHLRHAGLVQRVQRPDGKVAWRVSRQVLQLRARDAA